MLSKRDRAILEFESQWWRYPEPKDRAVCDYVGVSATRYYQALRRLTDDPEALRVFPLVIRRLRRMRCKHEESVAARLSSRDTVG